MMLRQKLCMIMTLLTIAGSAWAWEGSGTATDPYLIKNEMDWTILVSETKAGTTFSDKVFRLTADISVGSACAGYEGRPFSGIFDGDGHTMTISDETGQRNLVAPFRYVSGATIRHLRTKGYFVAQKQYAAGLVSMVVGPGMTTIDDCQSSVEIIGHSVSNAAHGGLVGAVASGQLTIERSAFTGALNGENSAGLVGWSNTDLTIRNSFVSPQERLYINGGRTFARMAGSAKLSLEECYYTMEVSPNAEAPQGEAVFNEVSVPDGCSYEILGAPDVTIDGTGYWKSGARVMLSVPDDVEFGFWYTDINGCYVSDPWTRNGEHQLQDLHGKPVLTIGTKMPKAVTEHVFYGVEYRYLSSSDYHLYLSDEQCRQRGWKIDKDSYLVGYDQDGDRLHIVAVTGYHGDVNRTIDGAWLWETAYRGTILQNDNVSKFFDRTHLAVIAPRAFKGCTNLRRIAFQSDDGDHFYKAIHQPDFIIGDEAFADCPNLEEIDMMYYNRTGTDKWEAMPPTWTASVADNAFSGSPNCRILVDPSVYQDYMTSDTWKAHQQRIGLYMKADEEMNVNGAKYSYMRNTAGEAVKNNAEGHEQLMQTLRYWNADYQQFSAQSLLAPADMGNIWYTRVTGADADYLRSHDGVMRIYNDPGSYYNYKTLAIGPNAFSGCKDLRAIEFWQTNGRSEHSMSNLKMVIQNGALAHCDSLKELRMYYYVQEFDDHWEVLGPEDVIPGDNIFGVLKSLDGVTDEQYLASSVVPSDFRIVVSPQRYQDFIDDPNWSQYAEYIVAAEYEPTSWNAINEGGLSYDYASKTVNTASTNQVVTQNLSWWNVPIKAFETMTMLALAKDVATVGSTIYHRLKNALANWSAAKAHADQVIETQLSQEVPQFNEMAQGLVSKDANVYAEKVKDALKSGAHNYIDHTDATAQPLFEKKVIHLVSNRSWWTSDAKNLLMKHPDLRKALAKAVEKHIAKFTKGAYEGAGNILRSARDDFSKAMRNMWEAVNPDLQNTFVDFASVSPAFPAYMALHTDMTQEQFQRGLTENIKANMHNVSYENTLIYTPDKKLIYHVYVDKPTEHRDSITIYNDIGRAYNYRTVAIKKRAFQGNQTLRRVGFAENAVAGSDSYVPMQLSIPDSAFAGCQNLERFNLTYKTRQGGMRGLGPENFILGGDSIFAGCDPAKLKIVIDIERKQDFLDDDIWKHYERYFVYTDMKEERYDHEYGVNYALYYDNNTTQRVSRVNGHKIEHLTAISADNEFLDKNQGSMGLMNDIGTYNNYKLDLVKRRAFKGNKSLRAVSFWDLNGGDAYTNLDMDLGDSCFVGCTNLANIDMLYCVTDGSDHIELLRPSQVRAGKGMLDGTNARIKMMPQQMYWFENDSAWAGYKDRFMPCIIQPADDGMRQALKDMCYYTPCNAPYRWTDYIDLARIAGAGFSWLDGRFREQKDDLLSAADFKYFETVGLDYVGAAWFKDCSQMSNILLPNTIKTIREAAFQNCSALKEIELGEKTEEIQANAFNGSGLQTVVVRRNFPARFVGKGQFPKNKGLKIFVPDKYVDDYRAQWDEFAEYIVGLSAYRPHPKHVTTTKKGELAEKLGLFAEISYSGLLYGDEMLCLHGNYAYYDSLTVSGPLDDLDLSVIRYLAGADSYHNSGGKATDGRLRYLDLKDAKIMEGSKYNYVHMLNGLSSDRFSITQDDEIPYALFYNCGALETVVLPRSLKDVRIEAFYAPNLKRIAFTNTEAIKYNHLRNGWMGRATHLLKAPLEELVFLTGSPATSDSKDPWGQTIKHVYTYQSQVGEYSGQDYLSDKSFDIDAPFRDEAVLNALADSHLYFPSQYMGLESVEGIFSRNDAITDFRDFSSFTKVKELRQTFWGCSRMRRITLPVSIERIGKNAFTHCLSLDSIIVESDSVPQLARNAFDYLPADFRIIVPKQLCKLYRTKWAQYADHICTDESLFRNDDLVTVTLTEPNTLDKALGLQMSYSTRWDFFNAVWPMGLKGDYGHIRRLKINGPISGGDLALLRHMAGYTPWTDSRNYLGHLEYLDLYDATLVASKYEVAPDKITYQVNIFDAGRDSKPHVVESDNWLPKYALLKAYSLKTLILPRTCTEVKTRALQECENIETLVIGDDMLKFNWDALDDCASMVRLYILGPKKLNITSDAAIWRALCNNYNPTFDAFYVRPSLYNDYAYDDFYTGTSWQRTNNISSGLFKGDEEFAAFGAHAAATPDDLAGVTSVKGWFSRHQDITDLTALQYTSIDSLAHADIAPLTKLEKIALPTTLEAIGDETFHEAENLRYVDMLGCDSTMVASNLRDGGLQRIGIDTEHTLVYLPQQYGETDETNVIVNNGSELATKTFRMDGEKDYLVPYEFKTELVENTRVLPHIETPYTVCLPYAIDYPENISYYTLDSRDGATLVFKEQADGMKALTPYLVKTLNEEATLRSDQAQTIPASGATTYGRQTDGPGYSLRGTLDSIDNRTATELGAYILQRDGNWHPVSSSTAETQQATILPFRAYLLPSARQGAARLDMKLIGASTTGIDSIRTIDRDGTERTYDLSGRRIDAAHSKGIIITNGKKFFKK